MLGEYQSQHLSSQSIEILFPHRRRTLSTRSYRPDGHLPPPLETQPRKLTKRQWVTLATFIIVNFCSAVCISLQAPFFPSEAEKKGATPTEYGLVFGIFELTVFIVSPFYGRFLTRIGPKFILQTGIFLMATCSILFGLLDKVPSHGAFLTFAFLIRIVEAVGNAGYLTAGFSIIAKEFPDNVATAFGTLETFFGLGIIAGPTIGGALYEVGGYTLPFVSLGILLLVGSVVTFFVLPPQDVDISFDKVPSLLSVLKIPSVTIAATCLFISAASIGFLSATLEPHLRQFSLTPFQIGLLFVVNGAVYGLTTPIWGGLCDKMDIAKILCAAGAFFGCISYLLLGPAPFFPFPATLWLCIVALVFHGLCIGGEIVCGFIDALRESIKNGFPDNLSTYGLVSSLYTSSFALGAFIGPSFGGFLLENIGFPLASMFMLGSHALLIIILVSYLLACKSKHKPQSDRRIPTYDSHAKSYGNGSTLDEKLPLLSDGSV